MTKTQIEEYFIKLENNLLNNSERKKIELSRKWANAFPNQAAVYLFRENGEVCYVGETGSIRGRMNDILNTRHHTIRRNIGNHYYSNMPNYEKPSSKKGFSEEIEVLLNEKIMSSLTISYILVDLGRKELEERLFDKFSPKYSIKGKRGTQKAYSLSVKRIENKSAYLPWSSEDDRNLELYYCQDKSTTELMEIFRRSQGAIQSRIKKLELEEKYSK